MNFVQIAGRLGKDPETRFTTNGTKVTSFSLASNVFRGGQEETIWWRVTVWGDRFDKMMQYLKKGSAIIVVGEISRPPELWTGNDGQPRIGSLEVTAEMIKFNPFGGKDDSAQTQQGQPAAAPQQPQQQHTPPQAPPASGSFGAPPAASPDEPTKDDLPF